MEPESQDEVEFYDAFGEDSSQLPSDEDPEMTDSTKSINCKHPSDSEDSMGEIDDCSDNEAPPAPETISFEENRANFKRRQLEGDKESQKQEITTESSEASPGEEIVLEDPFDVEATVVEEMLAAAEVVEEELAIANAEGSIVMKTEVDMVEEVIADGNVIDRVETVILEDSQELELGKVDSNLQIVEDQMDKLMLDDPFEADLISKDSPVDGEELIIDDPFEVSEERHDELPVASQNESFEVLSSEHGESQNPPQEESLSPLGGMLASWGGALGSWGRTAKAQVDKLYSGADLKIAEDQITEPAEQNNGEKSFAKLFSGIGSPKSDHSGDEGSPKWPSASSSGGSGWIGTIDKTFDYASGAFGSVLFSGIKKLESSMGVAIEPLSPSTTSPKDSVVSPDSTGSAEDSPVSPKSATDSQPQSEKINLTRNIYSTLEKLGKTTVNVVRSTKDRLMPLLEDDSLLRQRVTMEDLKAANGWKGQFDQYSGNDAMEKLQVKISQASLQVKSKLKNLNPKQLSEKQTMLKSVGKDLLTFSTDDSDGEFDWDAFGDLWRSSVDVDFIDRLIKCLRENAPDWEVKIAELEQQVESQFPVDRYLLFLYHTRSLLARRLSSAHFLLLSITDYSSEDMILQLCHACSRSLHQIKTFVQKPFIASSLLEERKQIVLEKLIVAEVNEALSILTDSVHSLQPLLRLTKI